jgi:nitrogen fixation protein NifU and related proteins
MTTKNQTSDSLYKEELMDIYKNPPNKGAMSDPTTSAVKNNPVCGDEITLQLKLEGGKISDAKFDGSACAVSVIASSLLTEHLIGKTVAEAKSLTKEDLLKLIGLNLSTSRVKCATLVLSALKSALEGF